VITTGATLEAAAKVLRRHGALRVGALAFARA
jgi:predicted amidophosphoribosyltransferase